MGRASQERLKKVESISKSLDIDDINNKDTSGQHNSKQNSVPTVNLRLGDLLSDVAKNRPHSRRTSQIKVLKSQINDNNNKNLNDNNKNFTISIVNVDEDKKKTKKNNSGTSTSNFVE